MGARTARGRCQHRLLGAALALAAAASVLTACAPASVTTQAQTEAGEQTVDTSASEPTVESPTTAPTGTTTHGPTTAPSRPVRLAFFGDTHATGASARVLTDGLGELADLFAEHDVVVGNLETAVLTDPGRAQPAPKQYTYGAPPELLGVLHDAGVDAVSLANNHGLDYGREGLRQTLAAAEDSPLAVIGVGTERTAYAPWTTYVGPTRVDVLAATDVLDSFAVDTWPPAGDRVGLASTKGHGEEIFLDAVRASAAEADVVVVFLHWGAMYTQCATERQLALADRLSAAGADVVVGSHAHILQGGAETNGAVVHYGLGNFVWYSARPGQPNSRTGVLSVTVDGGDADSTWYPATITAGVPELDGGQQPVPAAC